MSRTASVEIIQSNLTAEIKYLVKKLYDFTKSVEDGQPQTDALPELIIQDFDDEQIWQELELQNDRKYGSLISEIAHLVARKDRLQFAVEFQGDVDIDTNEESIGKITSEINNVLLSVDNDVNRTEFEKGSNSVGSETEKTQEIKQKPQKKKIGKQSVVDDQFFKLKDFEALNKFGIQKSKRRSREVSGSSTDEESIDWFGEDGDLSDEEKEGEHYSEFYDSPDHIDNDQKTSKDSAQTSDSNDEARDLEDGGAKHVTFNLVGDAPEDMQGDEDEVKFKKLRTNFDNRQDRLKSRISELEAELLADKPWQLKGEVSASLRPQNSLLEEVVEFDLTTRPAPVITEQTTVKLEDIIIQRVKDKAWDDVERKVKPIDNPQEYKKKLVLNQEKSKLSLAQMYEEDYLKQKSALEPDHEEKGEEPEAHHVIRAMMSSLFAKLDALSNFHYTPKPVIPEIKIISNIPAINIEEVAPVGTTTAMLLAPEEVKAKPKGDVIGKVERTTTDKKREHRHKKMMQQDRRKEREKREKEIEKIRPGLGNKYSKEKALKMLEKVSKDKNVTHIKETSNVKSVRSSTAFFTQLHDEVTSDIQAKIHGNKKQKLETSAKRVKL